MKKEMNKKGQDLSIGTLILIVLGIVVLVLLILGFSMGWENLWNKINIFGGGSSSVADITTACRLAVTSQDTYTLCSKTWDIKDETGAKKKIDCRDSRVLSGLSKNAEELGCTNDRPSLLTCPPEKIAEQLPAVCSDNEKSIVMGPEYISSQLGKTCCVPK